LIARLTGYRGRLVGAARRRLTQARSRLDSAASHRPFRRPFDMLRDRSRRLDELAMRATGALRGVVHDRERRYARLAGQLQSLSPLAVLERGYTITQDAKTSKVVRSAGQLRVGQSVTTVLADGSATSTVDSVNKK
jgi:exodeoxyribonuclease VII large subunit